MIEDRRRTPRFPVSCVVAFVDPPVAAPITNLSRQGCKVLARGLGLTVGQRLSLDISVEVDTIRVDHAVVRWVSAYHTGIEFLVMAAKAQAKLMAFLVTATMVDSASEGR